MSLSLVEELTQKQAPKFQINNMSTAFLKGRIGLSENVFVDEVLKNNTEGIFYLRSDFFNNEEKVEDFMNTLGLGENYDFAINHTQTNYEVMFKKKEVQK